MYALLALGFTMVYGIIELINFAHFNVFMVGSFFGMWVLEAARAVGPERHPDRACRWSASCCRLHRDDAVSGLLGVVIERARAAPDAQRARAPRR